MTKIAYAEDTKAFRGQSLRVIAQANAILERYARDGYDVTLRQLYYRFIALDLFPGDRRWRQVGGGRWVRDPNGTKNADPNYKWLGSIVNDGRLQGMIDWSHIIDRTRELRALPTWDSPTDIIETVARQYREDVWADQPNYVEVWVEKDALIGVVERAANAWAVPHFSCRGNTSQSAMRDAALRHIYQRRGGKDCHIIHLGDLDPSGWDMTRDIRERLEMFCEWHQEDPPEVHRVALNIDQVEARDLPPSPAKLTDSRVVGFMAAFGDQSWELDALPPDELDTIIQEAIADLVDMDLLMESRANQDRRKALLRVVAREWSDIADQYADAAAELAADDEEPDE